MDTSRLRITAIVVAFFSLALAASAQSTIFVVRHADRGPEEPDARLTALGLRQADELAAVLADAGIKHIYTTDVTRTQQTAAPTAKRLGVALEITPQTDFDGLIAKVKATLHEGEATLVVGHRQTVPQIVKALSGRDVPPLESGEFTRLTVITLFPGGKSSVVSLRYGFNPAP